MPRIFHVPNVSLNVSDAPDTPLHSGEDWELAVACDKVLDTFCHLIMYRNQFSEILVFHSITFFLKFVASTILTVFLVWLVRTELI